MRGVQKLQASQANGNDKAWMLTGSWSETLRSSDIINPSVSLLPDCSILPVKLMLHSTSEFFPFRHHILGSEFVWFLSYEEFLFLC